MSERFDVLSRYRRNVRDVATGTRARGRCPR